MARAENTKLFYFEAYDEQGKISASEVSHVASLCLEPHFYH